jgi:quinol monooxygenase YgiN
MVRFALLVRMEAKPGEEADVARLLRDAIEAVEQEPGTAAWFAVRFGPSSFGIFDAFPDEESREEHLGGRVAAALLEKAPELFLEPPVIEKADVLAAKAAQNGLAA